MTELGLKTLENFMFRTLPQDLSDELTGWREELRAQYAGAASDELRDEAAELLTENAVDLQSVLADWNLKNQSRHSDQALSDEQLAEESDTSIAILEEFGRNELASRARQ